MGIPGRDLLIGLIKVGKFTLKRGVPFYGLGPVLIQGKNNPNTSVSYILVSSVTVGAFAQLWLRAVNQMSSSLSCFCRVFITATDAKPRRLTV